MNGFGTRQSKFDNLNLACSDNTEFCETRYLNETEAHALVTVAALVNFEFEVTEWLERPL